MKESKLRSALTAVIDLVWAGILWLLCSLPVITLGAASTALYYSVVKCIRHERGGLTALLRVLAEAEISVEYLYAFVASHADDHAYVVLRVEDNARTEELLVAAGFALCTDELLKQA